MVDYFRPDTIEDALAARGAPGVRVAAGCTDLFPATTQGTLGGPVLDLTAIPDLRAIGKDDEGWTIGSCVTWTDVIRADLPPAFDMFKQAAREVGSVQIQNAGTVGGNLCNASPAADGVPCLLALDAEVHLRSAHSLRQMPLSDFLQGPRQTALATDELLTAIHVPRAATQGQSAFRKLGARSYLVISIAMVAARLEIQDGRITRAAVSVGACSPIARRLGAVEAALTAAPDLAGARGAISDQMVAAALDPIADIRADAAYRATAAAELVRRVVGDVIDDGRRAYAA